MNYSAAWLEIPSFQKQGGFFTRNWLRILFCVLGIPIRQRKVRKKLVSTRLAGLGSRFAMQLKPKTRHQGVTGAQAIELFLKATLYS